MTNAQQRVEVTGNPGSGTFIMGFQGDVAPAPVVRHPAAGEFQAHLESIPTVAAGNVVVSKESGWVYLVDFVAGLSNQALPELTVDYSDLPAGCTVVITTVIPGEDEGQGPDTGDPQQDAINLAYAVLTRAHHKGPYVWPQVQDVTKKAIAALEPFQTVTEQIIPVNA
jgi:hypothetical protein